MAEASSKGVKCGSHIPVVVPSTVAGLSKLWGCRHKDFPSEVVGCRSVTKQALGDRLSWE